MLIGSGVDGCSKLVESAYFKGCDVMKTISLSGKQPPPRWSKSWNLELL